MEIKLDKSGNFIKKNPGIRGAAAGKNLHFHHSYSSPFLSQRWTKHYWSHIYIELATLE